MESLYRGSTFGSVLSDRRKEQFRTQSELLESSPRLGALLKVRELNELEQDRLDPLSMSHFDEVVHELSEALQLDEANLRALAADHAHAASIEAAFQAQMQHEAVAFRARTQPG